MAISTHTPSASNSIYVMSLTDKDISIWRDPNQVSIGLYRDNVDALREIYTWDLRALAQRGVFKRIKKTDSFWYKLWLKNYTADSGSNIYKSLATIFTVSSFNHLDATAHVYSGSFSFSPLIVNKDIVENNTSETYDSERAIWQGVLFPAMPYLFAGTIEGTNSFGPTFLKRVSFTVSGENELSPVDISCEFAGGKSMLSPVMDRQQPQTISYANGLNFQPYRFGTMIDCLSAVGVFTNLEELKENLIPYASIEKETPLVRIVEMKLSMSQDVEFIFTGHKNSTSDEDGPRFAEITNRKVTGSFKFFSREDSILMGNSETNPDSGELTMYFGGPFLFPMSNVEWQKPIITQIPGQGFYHVYNFIARAANNAIQMGFKSSDMPVSEFDFATVVLDTSEEESEEE
jgi:hypothetical protein